MPSIADVPELSYELVEEAGAEVHGLGETALPPVPAGGFRSEDEVAQLPGARRVDVPTVVPGPSPDVYAFSRITSQRNLYRIPVQ